MANLFPTTKTGPIVTAKDVAKEISVIGYKQSVFYDMDSGQLLRDGNNKVISATGIEAWKQWCYNCLNTERYSCDAYPTDFGIETTTAMQAESREEAEAILSMEISDALMADPYGRTKYVSNVEFNWLAPDTVEITVLIQGIDDAKIDITTTIK